MDLGVFFHVTFSVESMSPKWTLVGISLMVALVVRVFEWMGARFTFLGFQSRWVDFGVRAPTEFSMVFGFVGTITFDAFGPLNSAWEGGMTSFPAVFALGNAGVHICFPNCSDIVANIKAPIDKHFSVKDIPNINPNDSHVRFWRYFNNSRFRCKRNIIKNMILFEYSFNVSWSEFLLQVRMRVEWDSYNFQVRFRFRETWNFYLKGVDIVRIFDILINYWHVRLLGDFVSDACDACVVRLNIID